MNFGRSEGLNECGLMVGQTSCGMPVGNFAPMRKPAVNGLQFWAIIRSLLENCKDVDEALKYVLDMPIASQKLLYSDRKIIDIAIESGFDSPESFSRAFKNVYQVSPSVYGQNRLDVFLGNKTMIDREFLHHISANITVQPQIRNISEIHVAGIRGTAALENMPCLHIRVH